MVLTTHCTDMLSYHVPKLTRSFAISSFFNTIKIPVAEWCLSRADEDGSAHILFLNDNIKIPVTHTSFSCTISLLRQVCPAVARTSLSCTISLYVRGCPAGPSVRNFQLISPFQGLSHGSARSGPVRRLATTVSKPHVVLNARREE